MFTAISRFFAFFVYFGLLFAVMAGGIFLLGIWKLFEIAFLIYLKMHGV